MLRQEDNCEFKVIMSYRVKLQKPTHKTEFLAQQHIISSVRDSNEDLVSNNLHDPTLGGTSKNKSLRPTLAM